MQVTRIDQSAIAVDDPDVALKTYEELFGVVAAHCIAFMHPSSAEGVLVELVEEAAPTGH